MPITRKRRVVKPRVPRTRASGTMTEARFWSYLRSGFRQTAMRWPPKMRVLDAAKRKSKSKNKKLTWEFQCSLCSKWFGRKDVEVDHIIPCGTLRCWEDVAPFLEKLFVEEEGLRVLCKGCHSNITKVNRRINDEKV